MRVVEIVRLIGGGPEGAALTRWLRRHGRAASAARRGQAPRNERVFSCGFGDNREREGRRILLKFQHRGWKPVSLPRPT